MKEPRIVSLLGSATEIVFELGLGHCLVGISHECDHPPEALSLPRLSRPRFDATGLDSGEIDAAVRRSMAEFGSVYEIDVESLRRLEPTHILTQAVCEVCAVPTGSVEAAIAALGADVQVVSLDAHSLEEIFTSIDQVAEAVGFPESGESVISQLSARLERVRARVRGIARPTVLMLEWLDPPFAPGHWVPQMVEIAGGQNLLGEPGAHSVPVEWAALAGLDPDVLLIEPCGFDLETGGADADRHREHLYTVAGRAIGDARAWVLHSAWFSRSGPRVVEGVEILSELLFPDPATADRRAGRARLWQ
jgi:iron complex transport system substrate-binding protein